MRQRKSNSTARQNSIWATTLLVTAIPIFLLLSQAAAAQENTDIDVYKQFPYSNSSESETFSRKYKDVDAFYKARRYRIVGGSIWALSLVMRMTAPAFMVSGYCECFPADPIFPSANIFGIAIWVIGQPMRIAGWTMVGIGTKQLADWYKLNYPDYWKNRGPLPTDTRRSARTQKIIGGSVLLSVAAASTAAFLSNLSKDADGYIKDSAFFSGVYISGFGGLAGIIIFSRGLVVTNRLNRYSATRRDSRKSENKLSILPFLSSMNSAKGLQFSYRF